MSLVRSSVAAAPAPPPSAPSFQVFRSQAQPTYHQLSLADAQGGLAHWVLPLPLKHLAKRAMLLWQLPAASPGRPSCLRTDLREGVLRLHFSGQLLRGYFRLHCLPEADGHLWQLIPIGQV